jgi:hypothetical protein
MSKMLHAQARIALLRQAARTQPQSVAVLYELAEALAEAGEATEAAVVFRRAYILQPGTCGTMLARSWASATNAEKLRDYARSLIDNGVAYSPVIAALAAAEAHLGNITAVQRLVDYDALFSSSIVDASDGCDRVSFCRTLAEEIKSDLKFFDAPPNRAVRHAWRHRLTGSSLPASRAWFRAIRREVDRYIAELPQDSDHPFLTSRPANYVLSAWAVVSDGASHHLPHIHPWAWLSGVFYVVRPAVSRDANSQRGWLEVGPPVALYGVAAAQGWAARAIAPEPGRLVLMPGYFFHRTRPMGADEERICIAFDAKPVELAGEDADAIEY